MVTVIPAPKKGSQCQCPSVGQHFNMKGPSECPNTFGLHSTLLMRVPLDSNQYPCHQLKLTRRQNHG